MPATKKKTLLRGHVIPNSHLDREWTLDYQQTRRLTVEFLDRLLEIFSEVPEYTFLLDSQTVPLEDYLEIRPEKAEEIRRHVGEGRLTIGPWYTAPDDNMLSGESIVRNLVVGHRVAAKYGPVMKVGYTPFGFGQVSQLPQIYAGFDIATVFFYRGISAHDTQASEFLWEAPDGTTLLCSRFGTKARYNFFMDVWRPVAYGRGAKDRMYHWREQTMAFKRIHEDREYDHYFVQYPRMELHRELLEKSFRDLLEVEREHFTTAAIPLMQGMDTTKPDALEAEIVRELQEFLHDGEEVFFSTLEKYAEDVHRLVDRKRLKKFRGEMRRAGPPNPYVTQLEHIYSGRVRQKIRQARAERALTQVAEPFAALAWQFASFPYPKTYLDLAWKYLLRCHAHDTVAGCGIDKLERDSHYRLEQVQALADVVLDDALATLQLRLDTSGVTDDEIVLTVYNPTARPRTELVDAYIDIPEETGVFEYELVDPSGKPVEFVPVYRRPCEKTVRDNTDLTTALVGWTCKTHFVAEEVPAFGWKSYVVRAAAPNGNGARIAPLPDRMENEHLIVEFHPNGTLDLAEKASGRRWAGLHLFQDEGENGNGWEWRAPGIDEVFTSKGSPARVSVVENTALSATIRVSLEMRVRSGLVHDDTHQFAERGPREETIGITSEFTLRRGARRLDVVTRISNTATNHRLRVSFPTGLAAATHSSAETPFDVVQRVIDRAPDHSYAQAPNPNHPCRRFVDVSDGRAGLAILTEGLHEYEVTDDPSRTIRLSLLRAYEVTLCTVSWRWERRPDQELSQVPGEIVTRYSLYPHDGNWEAGAVAQQAEDFHLPLVPVQCGGYEKGDWPMAEGTMLRVEPDCLLVSAVKRAEDRERLVVRLYNLSDAETAGRILPMQAPSSAALLNMNEEPLEGAGLAVKNGAVQVTVRSRQVVTVEIAFDAVEPSAKKNGRKKRNGAKH